MYFKVITFLFVFFTINCRAQETIDSVNFRSPLTIPLILSGNFGELRPNHFHTGLDIKTGNVIGKKVVSIEAGYVSRIAYSHYGYGRVLYIDHSNGYTSVYAHLSKFSSKIAKRVTEIERENESETFNVYLDSTDLVLTKGELIGLSGSSGSSYAPHLHFEIRETVSEHPVNPLLFGFKITDNIKPDVKGIKFYPLSNNATVNGVHKELYVKTTRISSGNYKLITNIKAHGKIGLGAHATDRLNGAGNVCGVYNLDLYCNNKKIFNHNLKFMDFDVNRYINHHKDYNEYHKQRRNIHKNYIKGNNKLPIYGVKNNNGIIDIRTDSVYKMNYNIKDAYGNTSRLNFNIKGDKAPAVLHKEDTKKCVRYFNYDESNYFDTTNFNVLMAENTLYDDQCITYSVKKEVTLLSDIHVLNTKNIPVHHYYKLQIKPNKTFDSIKNSKLIIVEINKKGNRVNRKGEFVDGYVSTRVREYGKYAVSIDTVKPFVRLRTNKKYLNTLKKTSKIEFTISDNLSGINTYKVYIDNKWVLSNYNRRNGRLKVDFKNTSLAKGKHTIKVLVTDERGNEVNKVIEVGVL
jgi:hypothetical protein